MSEVRTVRDIEIDIAWYQFEGEKMFEGDHVDRRRQKELRDLIKNLFKERSSFQNNA